MSKLTFLVLLLPIPSEIIVKIEKIAYSFLWEKRDKLRRRSKINDHADGGRKMVDIDSICMALKAMWIHRI